ncbi:hypothetical protein [Micromonospora sp. WMMC241]|uniref:hypothetical protein n=1 Tax=Micromonospora sp. WMMC241 TaxID=3015159 RepID=UPI003FA5771F
MALLGVRPTGALALLASAVAFAALLVRVRVPRPLLGSLVGVVTIAGNLVSGRVTYALGVAFGLAALLALTLPTASTRVRTARPTGPTPGSLRADSTGPSPGSPPAGAADPTVPLDTGTADWAGPSPASPPVGAVGSTGPTQAGAARWAGLPRAGAVGVAALLASATSPVAGLFVGLAGVALLLGRRWADGLLLAVPAAAPLAVTGVLFGEGGWMNISRSDTVHAVVTSLLVAALAAYRPVRVGALLSAAGVLAAALLPTPVGLNATRLVVMFALPVLAAAATVPRALTGRTPLGRGLPRGAGAVGLAALLAVVCWWQPPVVTADLRSADDPTADPAYFAPLRAELARRGLTGRVEVPPTRNYWEAARLGEVPLARGWLRQADIDRNPLFFTTVPGAAGTGVPLTADSYRGWLADNAVQYVAVPDAELSWVGRPEAELVTAGQPYLTEVWSDRHWRLYAVADPTPLVGAPGELVRQDGASVTFRTSAAGPVPVRVRHDRWLAVTGGATLSPAGDWLTVTVPRPGTYTLTS